MTLVYKVCSKDEWDHANLNKFYAGSEIDNKDGSEEIRITHKSGSYIHMKENGTIELKSLKKTRVI